MIPLCRELPPLLLAALAVLAVLARPSPLAVVPRTGSCRGRSAVWARDAGGGYATAVRARDAGGGYASSRAEDRAEDGWKEPG